MDLSPPLRNSVSIRALDDTHIVIETDTQIITMNAAELVYKVTSAIRRWRLSKEPLSAA